MRIIFEIQNDDDKTAMHAFFRDIVARPMSLEVPPIEEPQQRNSTLQSIRPKLSADIPEGFSATNQDGVKWSWNLICSHLGICSATLGKMRKATGEKYLICFRRGPRSTIQTSEELLEAMHAECRVWLRKRGNRSATAK